MAKFHVSFLVIALAIIALGFFCHATTALFASFTGGVAKIPASKNSAAVDVRQEICRAAENTVVNYVIDGDTIIVEGGWHVRLLGIDAQERDEFCYGAAKNRLTELVLNKQVRLQKDTSDVDQYGRCLRTVFLGEENIDIKIVKEGLAVARFYGPDVAGQQELMAAEKYAFNNNIGCLWGNP